MFKNINIISYICVYIICIYIYIYIYIYIFFLNIYKSLDVFEC